MALQFDFQSNTFGTSFPNSYAKITSFSGDKEFILFNLHIFASEQCRLDEKSPIEGFSFKIPYANQTLQDLYNYLKTLPEFAGATDV